MNTKRQKQLIPHYVAVVVLTVVTLGVVQELAGGGWINLLAVVVVVLTYPTLVRLLGVEPAAWSGDDGSD